MKNILSFIAYAGSVFVSWKFYDRHWIVGPVFALSLLLAHVDQTIKKFSLRHLFFIAASTLTYGLVYQIASEGGWKFRADWLDMVAGQATCGVIVGSLLMPALHSFIYGTDSKSARAVSLSLVISWYVVIFLSWLDEALRFKPDIPYLLIAIALWQGIYRKRLKPA